MSHKIGIPILKGMSSGHYKTGDTHINATSAAHEALANNREIRKCSDPDYQPDLTKENIVLYGCRYVQDAENERQKRIDEFNETAKRKVRSDSPVSCVGILKPDKELMSELSREDQILLLQRSFDEMLTLMNKTPENVIYAVIHVDEGNPHIHFELDGKTKDGRWSTSPMFQLKTMKALNETLPSVLNQKYGYHLEQLINPDRPKGRSAPGTRRKKKRQTFSSPEYKKNQDLKRENQGLQARNQDAKKELKETNDALKTANNQVTNRLIMASELTPPLSFLKFLRFINKLLQKKYPWFQPLPEQETFRLFQEDVKSELAKRDTLAATPPEQTKPRLSDPDFPWPPFKHDDR